MRITSTRLVKGALWAVGGVLVGVAGYHWFTTAPALLAAVLTALSAAFLVLQFYVLSAFGHALRRLRTAFNAVALILASATIALCEGAILHEPFGMVTAFVIPRPSVTHDVGEIEAKLQALSDAERDLIAARSDPVELQGAIGWAFAVVGESARFSSYDARALSDGDLGAETHAAYAEALGLLAAARPELASELRAGRTEERALSSWMRVRLAAVVVALLLELVARFGFAPWLYRDQEDEAVAGKALPPRLAYDEASGDYSLGDRTLSVDELMRRKWAPRNGAPPGLAPRGHCWQPYPSKEHVRFYALRRISRRKAEATEAARLKVVHSA